MISIVEISENTKDIYLTKIQIDDLLYEFEVKNGNHDGFGKLAFDKVMFHYLGFIGIIGQFHDFMFNYIENRNAKLPFSFQTYELEKTEKRIFVYFQSGKPLSNISKEIELPKRMPGCG